MTRAIFSNEDEGSYTIRSSDDMREVKFLASPAQHEQNREYVGPKELVVIQWRMNYHHRKIRCRRTFMILQFALKDLTLLMIRTILLSFIPICITIKDLMDLQYQHQHQHSYQPFHTVYVQNGLVMMISTLVWSVSTQTQIQKMMTTFIMLSYMLILCPTVSLNCTSMQPPTSMQFCIRMQYTMIISLQMLI